jgi:hypothetical protein
MQTTDPARNGPDVPDGTPGAPGLLGRVIAGSARTPLLTILLVIALGAWALWPCATPASTPSRISPTPR